MDTKKKNKGFTVIELMVTITLLGILLALGVPSFTSALKSNRATAEVDKFLGALNLARVEAIKRNGTVRICKSSDGESCGNGAVDWHDGWIIWADNDADNVMDSGLDPIIQIAEQGELSSLLISTNLSESQSRSVVYRQDGTARTGTGQFNFSFYFCPRDGDQNYAKTVSVATTGKPTVIKGATCS